MLHISGISRRRPGNLGATLTEVLVAVGIVGVLAAGAASLFKNVADSNARVESIMDRSMLIDYLSAAILNRESFQYTLAANRPLRTHLISAPATTASTSWQRLSVFDVENNQLIASRGSWLDRDAKIVPSAVQARWQVRSTWRAEANNSATVKLEVFPVERGRPVISSGKMIFLHKASQKQKCVNIRNPIVPGSNPRGNHTRQGPPYKYDKADVTCTDPYVLVSLNIEPGCGAIGPRVDLNPTNGNSGSCYQIAPTFPGQRALVGCGGTSLTGYCHALCCIMD